MKAAHTVTVRCVERILDGVQVADADGADVFLPDGSIDIQAVDAAIDLQDWMSKAGFDERITESVVECLRCEGVIAAERTMHDPHIYGSAAYVAENRDEWQGLEK